MPGDGNESDLVELGKMWTTTIVFWIPIIAYLTGTWDLLVHLIVVQPADMIVQAAGEAAGTFGPTVAESQSAGSTAPTQPVNYDDLSPGGFLFIGILQLAIGFIALLIMLAVSILFAIGVLLYVFGLIGSTISALVMTHNYLGLEVIG